MRALKRIHGMLVDIFEGIRGVFDRYPLLAVLIGILLYAVGSYMMLTVPDSFDEWFWTVYFLAFGLAFMFLGGSK